jgi:hypothetical protein
VVGGAPTLPSQRPAVFVAAALCLAGEARSAANCTQHRPGVCAQSNYRPFEIAPVDDDPSLKC